MPYINSVKTYRKNGFYHVYARGVNKRSIYLDASDYNFFKYLLKKYLTPGFKEKRNIGTKVEEFPVNTVSEEARLDAYTLMPNHFHMLIKNKEIQGIEKLSRRVLSVYVNYFNTKYSREGPLIQGVYRAVLLKSLEDRTQVTRYIHINPKQAKIVKNLEDYPYSSYKNYLYNKKQSWLYVDQKVRENTDWRELKKYTNTIVRSKELGTELIL